MKIIYGYGNSYVDITEQVFKKCLTDNGIIIPKDDTKRAKIFGDPIPYQLKNIIITDHNNNQHIFNSGIEINIKIPSISKQLYDLNNLKKWWNETGKFIKNDEERLNEFHCHAQIMYGDIKGEIIEQTMAIKFLNENAKVLEIGSNIGRNTIVIATILNNPKNLVTLESDPISAQQLTDNLKLNKIDTNVEACALSSTRLIQKGWDTIPLYDGDSIPEDWKEVATITYEQLMNKYNINFDTIVADCEGALFYIIKDYPQILDNVNLMILENDYKDKDHKEFINNILKMRGFKCIFSHGGGWGPCANFFWETWKKY